MQGDADELTRSLLQKVIIVPGYLSIELSSSGLTSLTDLGRDEELPPGIDLPFTIRRRGVESKITILGASAPTAVDEEMVKVVANARTWFEKLSKGEAESVKDIAEADGVDPGDVSRFLPLAFLAPDIVEAVLDGSQPVELTAEKLKRLRSLPMSWEDQRKMLGFAHGNSPKSATEW